MALKIPQLETFVVRQKPRPDGKPRRKQYSWRLRARNGQIQFTAGESFTRLDTATRAAQRAQLNMALAIAGIIRHQ